MSGLVGALLLWLVRRVAGPPFEVDFDGLLADALAQAERVFGARG